MKRLTSLKPMLCCIISCVSNLLQFRFHDTKPRFVLGSNENQERANIFESLNRAHYLIILGHVRSFSFYYIVVYSSCTSMIIFIIVEPILMIFCSYIIIFSQTLASRMSLWYQYLIQFLIQCALC